MNPEQAKELSEKSISKTQYILCKTPKKTLDNISFAIPISKLVDQQKIAH
jgi:hypothetical protein